MHTVENTTLGVRLVIHDNGAMSVESIRPSPESILASDEVWQWVQGELDKLNQPDFSI